MSVMDIKFGWRQILAFVAGTLAVLVGFEMISGVWLAIAVLILAIILLT